MVEMTSRGSEMPRHDRLKLARFAIELIAPFVKSKGKYHPAQPNMPAYWLLDWQGLQLLLAEQALLSPEDAALSSLLDVYVVGQRKVLSVRWQPSQPWMPPTVVSFKAGDWMSVVEQLGSSD